MSSLDHLRKTLIEGHKNSIDKYWIEAFKKYNAANAVKLSMSCRSCYYKVFKFVEKELHELD